jgi:hypothetical protein
MEDISTSAVECLYKVQSTGRGNKRSNESELRRNLLVESAANAGGIGSNSRYASVLFVFVIHGNVSISAVDQR